MSFDVKEVAESLAPIVSETVKSEVTDATAPMAEEIKNLSTEVVSLKEKMATSSATKDANAVKLAKQAVVSIFKAVKTENIQDEAQFSKAFDAIVKETYQNTVTATDGAEFVFEQFEKDVYAIFEQYPLLNELNTLQLLQGKSITLPTYDGGVTAYWIDEGANFTASKADTGSIKVDIYKLGALVSLTDEMLEDDMTTDTLYSLIIQEAGTKFALKLENEVLNGNQTTGKMKGILTDTSIPALTTTVTSFGAITDVHFWDADALIDEKYDINPGNKIAVMKKATKNKLITQRDTNGNLVFPELRDTGMIGDYRVVTARSMPAQATGAVGVLLGNVADFYRHVNRKGFNAEMGYLNGDFQGGKKTLRIERRDGGRAIDINAFAVIKIGTVA